MERLQKVMAHAGIASRRKSEELIATGLVRVNGRVITEPGFKVDPARDYIEVTGLALEGREPFAYFLLNKPAGYVTTLRDPQGRPTVRDLLGEIGLRVYPVGRLDYNTEGLLLLTNDGDLTQALTHPRHQVTKTYLALVRGVPQAKVLQRLAKGVELDDGLTAPAEVALVGVKGQNAQVEITIHEGKNRQVRRMFQTVGFPVLKLRRVAMGPLTLQGVAPGRYRALTPAEVNELYRVCGLKPEDSFLNLP